jgi:hypothetical protein
MFVRGKGEGYGRDAGLAGGPMECEPGSGSDVVVGSYCACVRPLPGGHYMEQEALLSLSHAPI